MKVSDFQYDLPQSAIAQSPVEPRHRARLLDTRDSSDHRFIELPDLLRSGDLVVVNETRVRAARIVGQRRETGGRVELLLLERRPDGSFNALARPARRLRPGVEMEFDGFSATVTAGPENGLVNVELDAPDPEAAIDRAGTVPLPPYFTGQLDDPERYQTMFATIPGSAAAPTAGLHFTEEVIRRLSEADIDLAYVDLHVSLDTFRPMTSEDVEDHQIHSEWCAIPPATAEAVERTRERLGRVVAIGTTVVRTLESMADGSGGVDAGETRTDLFLKPGVEFTVVDLLLTNFHLPGSTLIVLLAAFMGEGWRDAYDVALEREYRFLSFGDAMLAEKAPPRSDS
ncbi:MAG TPA: tRNA preQ1(34) S-adenosylmethionine ribosyltransferase-isomerase QueA [Acidimicrobiia bacterium]|nr:tRNA preQ1(34) S-adenosylmethionine ribosyltransferase-isomerase QueA [Acidimicrobiia bacterium]